MLLSYDLNPELLLFPFFPSKKFLPSGHSELAQMKQGPGGAGCRDGSPEPEGRDRWDTGKEF